MVQRAMLAVAYATGRVFHVSQVKGDQPAKKEYLSPPGWELAVSLTTPPLKNIVMKIQKKKKKKQGRSRSTEGCRVNDDDDDDENMMNIVCSF
jgi:hypothetical protein